MEGVPAVGALPSASWVFGSLRGVVLGWPGGPVPFLKIAFPPKKHIVLVVTAAIGEALVFFVFKKKKQNRTNNGWLQARSVHRERSAQRSTS